MRFGVDEAGKGPVLGSMFAAAVVCEPAALPEGIGDSKSIAPARREALAAEIRDVASVGVAEIPVDRIDDPGTDMNELTVTAQAEALATVLADGTVPSVTDDSDAATDAIAGTVDAGDVDADRFGRRVTEAVAASVADATGDDRSVDLGLDAAHGADEDDPLVGAASIVAKVERDAHVEDLAERYGDEYGPLGSGYPSDSKTRAFLAAYVDDHGELPGCARTSWSTCEDVLAASEQAALDDF